MIILLVFLGFKFISGIRAYYEHANNEAYRLIDDVLEEYGKGLYPLEVSVDEGDAAGYSEKSIGYSFKQKRGLDIFRKELTWEDIQNIREMMNTYLEEHPDYYLNDNYSIYINIQHANHAPLIAFTNDKKFLQIDGVDGLYDRLDCIIIQGYPALGNSSVTPVQVFKGAKAFYFDYEPDLEANSEKLIQMNTVEYYNTRKTDKMSE